MRGIARPIEDDHLWIDGTGEQRTLERLQRPLQQIVQVFFHGRDSTGSEEFERVDIERPANPPRLGQRLEARQPLLE